MSSLRTVRHRLAALAVAALVLAPVAPLHSSEPPLAAAGGAPAHVDPALLADVAAGPAPAILSWDDREATREQVRAYLEGVGVRHQIFSAVDTAIGCVASEEDVAALAAAPGAISVWADEEMTPAVDESVPTAFNGDPNAFWVDKGITGEGVGIAVLDTGIDGTHPDLEYGRRTLLNARVIISHYEILGIGEDTCAPDTFQEDLEDSETISGHGTHLASVAAGDGTASGGRLKGMAPGADLIGLNILEEVTPQHQGDVKMSLIRFIAGANYVITRSLQGGPTITKVALLGWTAPGLFDPWHPHYLVVRDLYDFGISVVMPVGNEGDEPSSCDRAETCHFNRYAVGQYPIAVGATPKTSRTQLADYSSRGDVKPREVRGETVSYEPTLVAPGTRVVAALRPGLTMLNPPVPTPYPLAGDGDPTTFDPNNPEYQALTGTSVAAAHVAGTIALMQQAAVEAKGCFLSSGQVKHLLAKTATPMANYERWQVGSGALDASAAITAAIKEPIFTNPDPWNCPGLAG